MIKPLIEEATEALKKNEGSEFLNQYLDKIKEIKEGTKTKDESYEDFLKTYKSTYNFNLNVRKPINNFFLTGFQNCHQQGVTLARSFQ